MPTDPLRYLGVELRSLRDQGAALDIRVLDGA